VAKDCDLCAKFNLV